jgi:predicted DNA-binding antitoxin AbrB/MazE fold protein
MTVTVEAIYEQGILRLSQPIPLAEGTHVQVTIISPPVEFETKSPSQILKDIAAIPLQGKQDEFSGRDHDAILYPQHDVL